LTKNWAPTALDFKNLIAWLDAGAASDGRSYVDMQARLIAYFTRRARFHDTTFPSGVAIGDSLTGTCSTCHDSPNAGSHSVKAPLNIGVADPSNAPYLPVYTRRRCFSKKVIVRDQASFAASAS
jgi:hypothetical protein